MDKSETPVLISVNEAARIATVSPMTIRRAIGRGEIPAVRVGERSGPYRVEREPFLRWLYGNPHHQPEREDERY
jgi:excisionase family DNA binding protein